VFAENVYPAKAIAGKATWSVHDPASPWLIVVLGRGSRDDVLIDQIFTLEDMQFIFFNLASPLQICLLIRIPFP
jgi:hypothetical protein